MVKFCRNCGKELAHSSDQTCTSCGDSSDKATAFCRFCGGATTAQEVICPKCGSAIGVTATSIGTSTKLARGRLTRTRVILGILAVVTFVSLFAVFVLLPGTALRRLQSAASSVVIAALGYSSIPLNSISASPSTIPEFLFAEKDALPGEMTEDFIFPVNATHQLNIIAHYQKPTTRNAAATGRMEDVTAKSTYRSSNDKIATVTSGGLVQGVSVGLANITASYTAAPGSANLSALAAGKIPITVSVVVPVAVNITFTGVK